MAHPRFPPCDGHHLRDHLRSGMDQQTLLPKRARGWDWILGSARETPTLRSCSSRVSARASAGAYPSVNYYLIQGAHCSLSLPLPPSFSCSSPTFLSLDFNRSRITGAHKCRVIYDPPSPDDQERAYRRPISRPLDTLAHPAENYSVSVVRHSSGRN